MELVDLGPFRNLYSRGSIESGQSRIGSLLCVA